MTTIADLKSLLNKKLFVLMVVVVSHHTPVLASADIKTLLPVLFGVLDVDPSADYDGDGLTNEQEDGLGTNYNNADSDGDGLSDSLEVEIGSNPLAQDPDSDGDGLIDLLEVAIGSDPFTEHSDTDGLTDQQEYELGTNPVMEDSDGDGLSDVDELYYGTDPVIVGDFDGDGVLDDQDSCRDYPNLTQLDANGDGIGDACQCGDVTGDGALTAADVTAMQNFSTLPLASLARCDVTGDGVCNTEDESLLGNYLSAPTQTVIRTICPTLAETYDKVLNRLGYGPDEWSRNRIRQLGTAGYINEQLNPGAINDADLNQKLAPYSDEARYPTMGKSTVWLKSHYCSAADPYCDESFDGNSRIWGNQSEIKFLRSVYSKRQLHFTLLDLWFNHFNVFSEGGNPIWTLPRYEQAIGANMYGSFVDMITAVTLEPSMMDYLDLQTSKMPTPNENYARELMELHTIGPENYPDELVNHVAKVLSGFRYTSYYNISQLGDPVNFNDGNYFQPGVFSSGSHVNGLKTLDFGSGTTYQFAVNGTVSDPANAVCNGDEAVQGENEMKVLLCLLAAHPGSAEMVGEKLILRLLGDHAFEQAAPVVGGDTIAKEVVEAVQATWVANGGNLKSAVQTVLTTAPAGSGMGSYFERSLYLEDSKVKRPLHFSVSLVRALGAGAEGSSTYQKIRGSGINRTASFRNIMGDMENLGESLYRAGPPTGYSEASADWLGNSGFFIKLNQINRLVSAVSNPIEKWKLYGDLNSNEMIVARVAQRLMPGGGIDDESSALIVAYLETMASSSTSDKVKEAAKLILGSPSFLSQ